MTVHPPYGTAGNATKKFPVSDHEMEAIVDTGSERTLLRADIASKIGLDFSNFTDIILPGVQVPVECFTAFSHIRFTGEGGRTWSLPCDVVVVDEMRHEMLLGMDSFEDGEIRVNFHEGWWSFQVPLNPYDRSAS